MTKRIKDIQDDQIRIVGDKNPTTSHKIKWIPIAIVCLLVIVVALLMIEKYTYQRSKRS